MQSSSGGTTVNDSPGVLTTPMLSKAKGSLLTTPMLSKSKGSPPPLSLASANDTDAKQS